MGIFLKMNHQCMVEIERERGREGGERKGRNEERGRERGRRERGGCQLRLSVENEKYILTDSYAKCYNPGECLAVEKIIQLYGGRAAVPKKHKRFRIRIYILCDSKGYIDSMIVYLGR